MTLKTEYNVRNIFFQKQCRKWVSGANSILFLFFEKTSYKLKQVVSTWVSIFFGSPRLKHTIKASCIKLVSVDLVICSILVFRKGSGTSFYIIFCVWFFKKIISSFIFYQMTKSHCLKILDKICIVISCSPLDDVRYF